MMGMTSQTGTLSTIAAVKAAKWGWIVVPTDRGDVKGDLPYGLDNGGWPAFMAGREIDLPAFERAVDRYGAGAMFIVVPDIVLGGARSLALSIEWLQILLKRPDIAHVKLLIAVQDGFTKPDIAHLLNERVGIFVGGSAEWKEASLPMWSELKRETRCYLHVGRVNTKRRIALCDAALADSFDGTSVCKFPKTLAMLDDARKQISFEHYLGGHPQ